MGIADSLNMIKTLQGMDIQEQQLALQQEQQRRLMEAEKRKMAIRGSMANALQQSMAQQIGGYGQGGAFDYRNPQDVQSILQEADPQELNQAAMNIPAHQAQLYQAGPEGAEMAMQMGPAGGVGDTDTARYAELIRQAYREENDGKEIPSRELANELMRRRRALPPEKGQARDATNQSDFMWHPLIQDAIAQAKAEVNLKYAGPMASTEEGAKLVGADNFQVWKSADTAVDQIGRVDTLLNHLETADINTGLGAELFQALDRAKALFGASGKKASDTEFLDALMGSEVFPLIKQLGIGARGLDTPAEREFLRKVMTGVITLNKQTLIDMAKLRRTEVMKDVDRYNKRVENGQMNSFFEVNGIPKEKLNIEPYKSAAPEYTEDQEYEALKALGPIDSQDDAKVDAWLKQKYGGS